MNITASQLQKFLEDSEGKEIPGEHFTFELDQPKKGIDHFPYTIRLSSPNWSEKNVSTIGPENIKRYLDTFNKDNDAPASAYRNLGKKESISKNARYLVKILKQLAKQ